MVYIILIAFLALFCLPLMWMCLSRTVERDAYEKGYADGMRDVLPYTDEKTQKALLSILEEDGYE